MAELWARGTVAHLLAQPWLGRDTSVLDFGCGYFDVGLALANRVQRIDGLEIDAHSLEVAKRRSAQLTATRIFRSNAEVPTGLYDLILANSVFQYLGDDDAIRDTLRRFKTWLKPGGRGEVLLVDLIPSGYSPARDALHSLLVAARYGILPSMMRYLWSAAFRRRGLSWRRIDPNLLGDLAGEAGFAVKQLPANLAPSRRRYSCVLRVT